MIFHLCWLIFFAKWFDETVEINEGKIVSIVKGDSKQGNHINQQVIDYGDAVVMPGLIDV